MALIAVLAVEQQRASNWPARLTPMMRWALVGSFLLLLLHLRAGTFALHSTLAIFAGLAGGEFVLAMAAYSAIRYARTRPDFAMTWLLAFDWLALLVVLPALLALPLQEGTDYFCINGVV
jgi:hypothetical protein